MKVTNGIRTCSLYSLSWGAFVLLVVTALALLFFRCQLTGRCSFTYDFVMGYHAVNSYIVEHLRAGIWPEWVAQQSLGYPLYMQVQSDLFYPVLWLFALADVPYTLRLANALQVAHICFGALGAYYLARKSGVGRPSALWGAAAYFTMGGFFDGAQHVDIVRGYAYIPWCLAALQLVRRINGSDALLRFFVFAGFFLSAYPGQIIAFSFVAPVFIVAQAHWKDIENRKNFTRNAIVVIGLLTVAAGAAIPKYLPFFLEFASEVSRSANFSTIGRASFQPQHLFSFALDTSTGDWPADITLRSHYVGVTVLALLFIGAGKPILNRRPFLAILPLSLALSADIPIMLFGEHAKIFGLSRINIADYKAFVILPMIVLAAMNLDSLCRGTSRMPHSRILIVFFFLIGYLGLGLIVAKISPRLDFGISVFSLASVLSLVWMLNKIPKEADSELKSDASSKSACLQSKFVYLCVPVLIANSWAVHSASGVWRDRNVMETAKYYLGFDVFNAAPPSSPLFAVLSHRPTRKDLGHMHNFTWKGFYTGDFVLKGYDASKNLTKHAFLWTEENYASITSSTTLIDFFRLPGCALTFEKGTTAAEVSKYFQTVTSPLVRSQCDESRIKQSSYSSRAVGYDVVLDQDAIVVENEIAWKGWKAVITGTGIAKELEPLSDFSPYRAWFLPKGTYTLRISFENTHRYISFLIGGVVSSLGLLFVIYVLYVHRRKFKKEEAESHYEHSSNGDII